MLLSSNDGFLSRQIVIALVGPRLRDGMLFGLCRRPGSPIESFLMKSGKRITETGSVPIRRRCHPSLKPNAITPMEIYVIMDARILPRLVLTRNNRNMML